MPIASPRTLLSLLRYGLAITALYLLSACSFCGPNGCVSMGGSERLSKTPTGKRQQFVAIGYGAIDASALHYTPAQKRLMAMRAARIDAYRNLAEQVYGFRIKSHTPVSEFITRNDRVQNELETFIQGAKISALTEQPDGSYQATVVLNMPQSMLDQLSSEETPLAVASSASSVPPVHTAAAMQSAAHCTAGGCVASAAHYNDKIPHSVTPHATVKKTPQTSQKPKRKKPPAHKKPQKPTPHKPVVVAPHQPSAAHTTPHNTGAAH